MDAHKSKKNGNRKNGDFKLQLCKISDDSTMSVCGSVQGFKSQRLVI